jgi:TolB protein
MIKRLLVFLICSTVVTGKLSAQTDVHLKIESSGRGKIPIVLRKADISDRKLRHGGECIETVLHNDLVYGGIFDPVSLPAGVDTIPEGRTAVAVLEMKLQQERDRMLLAGRLIDFTSGGTIFEKKYRFSEGACRTVAHYLSDEITFFLTGETGIATTRLLFLRREGGRKCVYLIDYDGHGLKRMTGDSLAVSPVWVDRQRFCFTSYRNDNPDCYMIDLKKGARSLISYRKGLNIAGSYHQRKGLLLMTLSISGNSELFMIDTSGRIERRLTKNRAIDCSPVWSPNGREIAFVSDRTTVPQIYIMDEYGGNLRRLTTEGNYNTSPDWSPRGDLITFVSREDGLYRLKVMTPDGMWGDTVFRDYLSYEDPSWAPDGSHIAVSVKYGGEPWIVIVNIETGEKRRLTRGESPAWSPAR